ncbi:hypothetical protein MJ1HA_0959 [Metallosphaera sedula]|nr:hypothetical protein MJ1HA_0959 [Metallosphaera sedula]
MDYLKYKSISTFFRPEGTIEASKKFTRKIYIDVFPFFLQN